MDSDCPLPRIHTAGSKKTAHLQFCEAKEHFSCGLNRDQTFSSNLDLVCPNKERLDISKLLLYSFLPQQTTPNKGKFEDSKKIFKTVNEFCPSERHTINPKIDLWYVYLGVYLDLWYNVLRSRPSK